MFYNIYNYFYGDISITPRHTNYFFFFFFFYKVFLSVITCVPVHSFGNKKVFTTPFLQPIHQG